MTSAKTIAAVFSAALLAHGAEAATLTWNANTEANLAGYRVYQCSATPCNFSSGSLFATLGKVTSFNIGTPSAIRYYFITAYDLSGKESGSSNVVSYSPSGSPPPTSPSMKAVNLTVVGTPSTGPWGVAATINDLRPVFARVFLDGSLNHTENVAPWSFPGDNGISVTLDRYGRGTHTVEFVFYLKDTTTEIGRGSVTVQEGTSSQPSAPLTSNPPPPSSPPPSSTVNLSVVGSPATGPWGVAATINDLRPVFAKVFLDGSLNHTENVAPWSFPGDNGLSVTPARFGNGSHRVEFVFYLVGTTTEIGRGSVTVQEGASSQPSAPPSSNKVNLSVVGSPATGPWGVAATINDSRPVFARVFLDGSLNHTENVAPWSFPGDNGVSVTPSRYGRGTHTVEFVFYLQGTTTEIGRGKVTVQEG